MKHADHHDDPSVDCGQGETQGVGTRLDTALTARGFTTRRLRLRAAAVIVAITAGVSGVLLYNLTNVLGPDSVCGGAATADEVHAALGPGRISEEKSDGWSPSTYDGPGSCVATVSSGLFGKSERSASFHIAFDAKTADGPAAPDARLFSGDAVGGVTGSKAWAVLPEGCTKGLRAEVGLSDDSDRVEGLARLAVVFANTAAKERNCGDGRTLAVKSLSAQGARMPVDFAGLCGLPGMAPAKAPDAKNTYRQQATTAFTPVWSCAITSDETSRPVETFSITTEPRVTGDRPEYSIEAPGFGRARWTADRASRALVVTCQGKPVYFSMGDGFAPGVATHYLFPDRTDLWKQFLTAGGTAIGCEPIIP
ncbi:hypothetical protein [Kitasatospora sp. NPDC091207]|uniref:hypothetical protein n=1 Tax=Kitasatospora sp. NPDC091207 TaxID=3364083 RepID=UPI00381AE3D3